MIAYGRLCHQWFAKLHTEEERPNVQQLQILTTVRDRILLEFALEKEGPHLLRKVLKKNMVDTREEPLRGLIHGLPGTGKSRVIKWICRLFTEALGWEHGVEFVCVAFQNRVAHAMGGYTLHP